jgi:hypothetical protein
VKYTRHIYTSGREIYMTGKDGSGRGIQLNFYKIAPIREFPDGPARPNL